MKYQAEMLAQVLRLAQVKAQELVQAVPQGLPRLEQKAVLLQQEVLKVQRQALALQQQAALQPQVEALLPQQEVPLLELGVPQQQEAEVLRELEQAAQQELAAVQVQALVEAEAQVEVLEPQEQELVQVPLLEEEWVGWVQVQKE